MMHAEDSLLPFIEKMRESPAWEKEVCQGLSDKDWCASNRQAAPLYKQFMQLLSNSGVLPDHLILRISGSCRLPVRPYPLLLPPGKTLSHRMPHHRFLATCHARGEGGCLGAVYMAG